MIGSFIGTSMSSTTTSSALVRTGGRVQASCGETLSPYQRPACRGGTRPSGRNDVLVSVIVASPVGASSGRLAMLRSMPARRPRSDAHGGDEHLNDRHERIHCVAPWRSAKVAAIFSTVSWSGDMPTKLPLVSAALSSSVSWSFHASTLIGAFLEMYAPTLVPRTHPRHLGPALGEGTNPLGESTYPPEESTYPPEERRNLLGERTC